MAEPLVEVTRCERLPSGDWLFAFSASGSSFEEMVRSIKYSIPSHHRKWSPERKCWLISDIGMRYFWDFMPQLREPMQRMARSGGQQTHQQQRRQQSTRGNVAPVEVAEAFALLFLLPSAPLAVIKAAYRALANIHHPDHGGNTETMKRLNSAHEKACAWANKQASKAS